MVAVRQEIEDKNWPHARLVRWGAWARCAVPGAVGSAEGYLREPIGPSHDGEPTEEIAVTDRAVARMRVDRKDYWPAFARFYLNPTELSYYEIALDLGHGNETRVEAIIRQARILVGHHIYQLQSAVNSLR